MSLWIFANMLMALSLSLLLAPTPLAMGLTILMIALMTAAFTACAISSWFAFLIFLIYIGGMLIMFSYFLALTPNQPSIFNQYLPMVSLALMLMLPSSMLSLDMWLPYTNSSFQVELMFSQKNFMLLFTLTLILLFTMVAVVKISTRTKGPLRAFMSYV